MTMNTDEMLLTTAEVSKVLRCTVPTVLRYIREGKFSRVYFIGKGFLIPKNAVDEFLENTNVRGKGRID